MRAYSKMVKLEDYLYKIEYPSLDYEYAHKYFRNNYDILSDGSCSAVYSSNGLFGKNLDLTYDESVSFIVINKFGTYDVIGVAGGIKRLNKDFVESGRHSKLYKILPFVINSGMNSAGVYAGLNIVPNGDAGETTGTNPDSLERVNALMLVRYILDKCGSAKEAIWKIQMTDVYCPHTDDRSEEYHLIVGDEKECYIVEFIDNKTVIIPIIEYKWITNYYRDGVEFNSDGTIDWTTLTPHANGTYRNNIIAETFAGSDMITEEQMKELMRDKLRYTRTYEEPEWYDEFCGVYPVYGDLTQELLHNDPSSFDGIFNEAKSQYEERVRGLTSTWQTVSSTIYNIVDKTINIVVDEGDVEYEFDIAGNDLNQTMIKAPCGGLLFDETQFEIKETSDGTRYVGMIEKEVEPPIEEYLKKATVEDNKLTIEDQDGTLIEYDPTPEFEKVLYIIEDEADFSRIPTLLEEYKEVLYHYVGNKYVEDPDGVVRLFTYDCYLPYSQLFMKDGLTTYMFSGDAIGVCIYNNNNVNHVYELSIFVTEGSATAREQWVQLDSAGVYEQYRFIADFSKPEEIVVDITHEQSRAILLKLKQGIICNIGLYKSNALDAEGYSLVYCGWTQVNPTVKKHTWKHSSFEYVITFEMYQGESPFEALNYTCKLEAIKSIELDVSMPTNPLTTHALSTKGVYDFVDQAIKRLITGKY